MTTSTRNHDIAYGCFLVAGVVPLLVYLAGDFAASMGRFGIYFFGALTIGALLAMFTAIRFSLPLRNHWPLTVLSVWTLLYIAEIFVRLGPPDLYERTPVIYGSVTVLVSLSWFLFLRARHRG